MARIPHAPLLIGLGLALLAAAGVAASGKFDVFDAKGILSGPFSALMLLSASLAALMLVLALDWRVWQPRRRSRAREFERWLAADVLGNPSAPPPGWTVLNGNFRGRDVTIARAATGGMRGLQWKVAASSALEMRVIRLETPQPPPVSAESRAAEFSSGDDDFEALYAWQTHTPREVLPLLRNAHARTAIKRMASLIAQRGKFSHPETGIIVESGSIRVLQVPAPDLSTGSLSPDEALMVLHDLTEIAACLEGRQPAASENSPALTAAPADPLSAWLGVGCFGMLAIVLWMGATWMIAHYLGLAPAMVVFFIPPVLLAFLFLLGTAGGSGRQAELEEVIQKESAELTRRQEDLKNLRLKMTL